MRNVNKKKTRIQRRFGHGLLERVLQSVGIRTRKYIQLFYHAFCAYCVLRTVYYTRSHNYVNQSLNVTLNVNLESVRKKKIGTQICFESKNRELPIQHTESTKKIVFFFLN